MDRSTKIAGELTIDNWLLLKDRLEKNFNSVQLWEDAYIFFEKRITSRYLKPIEAIKQNSNIEGEGFAISAILCSLIEALETFRQGKLWKRPGKDNLLDQTKEYYKSKPIFESFLINREPFKIHFSK